MIFKPYQHGKTEAHIKAESMVYFVEISSNVYYVAKDRTGEYEDDYVDGSIVCEYLRSGMRVGIKSLKNGVLANFRQERTVE